MFKRKLALPLIVLSLLFISCDKDGDGTSADIFPGQGLTEIKFTNTGSDATSKFGNPGIEASVGNTHQWTYGSLGIALVFNDVANTPETETIDVIMVNPGYDGKTAEGIGIGSSKADVIAAYGEPTRESFPWGFVYEEQNIMIDYNEEKVKQIRLMK